MCLLFVRVFVCLFLCVDFGWFVFFVFVLCVRVCVFALCVLHVCCVFGLLCVCVLVWFSVCCVGVVFICLCF